eukprot:Protomagalhaensia_wolfi_Nauph_80__365@NODE_11_length_5645_cov_36_062790_g8_i0_p6_GENE_NODE_11_length_5645_cov_36_062790_g8_i0NODE_11_length_5645_cov_36_062790_g8_i0_p6_ORF_typecomplete_len145_score6_61DUF4658/PF15555_6/0_032_NODE_11_length_5645_cov_36_062790_g8_i011171551
MYPQFHLEQEDMESTIRAIYEPTGLNPIPFWSEARIHKLPSDSIIGTVAIFQYIQQAEPSAYPRHALPTSLLRLLLIVLLVSSVAACVSRCNQLMLLLSALHSEVLRTVMLMTAETPSVNAQKDTPRNAQFGELLVTTLWIVNV